MAKRVQLVRHDTSGADAFIGFEGEITIDTSRDDIRVHDGATAGGHRIGTLSALDILWSADDATNLVSAQAYADAQDLNQIPDTIFSAANQIIYSTGVAVEAALAVAANTLIGRVAGAVDALTPAEVRALLALEPEVDYIPWLTPTSGSYLVGNGAAWVAKATGNAAGELVVQEDIYKHSFGTGTKLVAFQAVAPTGWTQDVTQNDKVLRVVSAAGGGTGGSWTISGITVDGHAVTTAEMPVHTHTPRRYSTGSGGPAAINIGIRSVDGIVDDSDGTIQNVNLATTSAGSGSAHNHNLSFGSAWRPAYIDVIVITKDAP